jgi:hypothetical protein
MLPTVAMAVLADHFHRTTGRPRWFDIADLFNVFAPQLRSAGDLTREHIRHRVDRIRKDHLDDFRRFVRAEAEFEQVLRVAQATPTGSGRSAGDAPAGQRPGGPTVAAYVPRGNRGAFPDPRGDSRGHVETLGIDVP